MAAQFGKLLRHVLRLAVDVAMGAELPGERLLVRASGDGDCMEAHLHRELHAQVPQPADAENTDQIAGAGPAVAQGVVGGDAGTQQRSGVLRR
jgi:hypothetical protein